MSVFERRRAATIYLAGPYTAGDPAVNVHKAHTFATLLREKGWTPIIPHANHLWHLMDPHPYEYWIKLDRELLELCGAFCRFDPLTPSPGADGELAYARELGLVIYGQPHEVPRIE